MKSYLRILLGIAIAILFFVAWRFESRRQKIVENPGRSESAASTPNHVFDRATSMPDTNSASIAPSWMTEMNPKVIGFKARWATENTQPQDFYGKVIDQYGQAIEGVEVIGELGWIQGFDKGPKTEIHKTETDSFGEFQFTGIYGWQLGVNPRKQGYELAPNTKARQMPPDGKTSPTNRAIFTMWKLKGAESLVESEIRSSIPCDGTVTSFDLLLGRKIDGKGDLVVKLVRTPVNIIQGKPFDWTVTLEMSDGGLIEMVDLYPNEAPADGYQPSVTISMPAGAKNWSYSFERSFYFKIRGGNDYGRMKLNIGAGVVTPPSGSIGAEIYINPFGSRNLELDVNKRIRSARIEQIGLEKALEEVRSGSQ